MTTVLVAGIGNILLRDDGFGSEVARRVAARPHPPGVKVEDFGIRGVHLAYELLNGYGALVLIDAMPLQETAGTVCVFEPELPVRVDGMPAFDAHTMSPGAVLNTLAALGGTVERIVVVGCAPETVEEGLGLSGPVAAAVDDAAAAVCDIVDCLCEHEGQRASSAMISEGNADP